MTRVPTCAQVTGPRVIDLLRGYTAGQKPGRTHAVLRAPGCSVARTGGSHDHCTTPRHPPQSRSCCPAAATAPSCCAAASCCASPISRAAPTSPRCCSTPPRKASAYNLPDTLKCQHTAKLTRGHCLYSDMGRVLCCHHRRHLRLARQLRRRAGCRGGRARSTAPGRYPGTAQRLSSATARDNLLVELGKWGLGPADLLMNLNLFSKVTVDADGALALRPRQLAGRRLHRAVLRRWTPWWCSPRCSTRWIPNPRLRAEAGAAQPGTRSSATARRALPQPPPRERARLPQHRTSIPAEERDHEPAPDSEQARPTPPCIRTKSFRPASPGWRASQPARPSASSTCEGNQAVDTLFYNARRPARALQRAAHHAPPGQPLPHHRHRAVFEPGPTRCSTIVADTCGRHDTLGGACAAGEQHRALRAGQAPHAQLPRQLPAARWPARRRPEQARHGANINFFMNVPVTPEGGLTFDDGISAPGKYVEMRAEMDVLVLISNCPQLNNPCNAYNPTPESDWLRRSVRDDPPVMPDACPVSKVLIANRGAIACRIIRTLRALGVDVGRRLLRSRRATRRTCAQADEAVRLGPAPAAESYLRADADPRGRAGAPAPRPSTPATASCRENAGLRRGLRSRRHRLRRPDARRRCAPSASSTPRATLAEQQRRAAAARHRPARRRRRTRWPRPRRIGYPVMLKSTAGGGGIGMRAVLRARTSWREAFDAVRAPGAGQLRRRRRVPREVRRSSARHIEVQIFGDGRGRRRRAGRARLLGAAAQPEGASRKPRRPTCRQARRAALLRDRRAPRPARSTTARPARSSSSTTPTPASSTSSRSTPACRSSTASPRRSPASTWSSGWCAPAAGELPTLAGCAAGAARARDPGARSTPKTRRGTSSPRRACSPRSRFPRRTLRVDTWVETGTEVTAVLRPDAGQAHRHGRRPRRGAARQLRSALAATRAARHRDQPRLPAPGRSPTRPSPQATPDHALPRRLRTTAPRPSRCSSPARRPRVQDWPGRTRLLGRRRAAVGADGRTARCAWPTASLGNAEGAAALEITADRADAALQLRRA